MANEEKNNAVSGGDAVPDGGVTAGGPGSGAPVKPRDTMLSRRLAQDWTQGNILKNLMQLSWPMMVTQTLMSLGPTIDMVWVGKLGDVAVAGVGISGVAVMLAQGLMMGFTQGMRALIARAIGAKDADGAHLVAQQAVVVAAAFAVLMALVGHFFGQRIVSLITSDPDIVQVGTIYLRIEFIGGATMTFRMLMDGIMQASGDSVNPMWITIVYRVFHIALCPFLIFGWWFFPELGVRGAAYTGIIAQALGILLGLRVLIGARSRLQLTFKNFRFAPVVIWRIIRIGFPASIAGIQRSLNQFFLQIFMAPFGAAALAAHVIVQRLEMFIMMPAFSFGQGAGVLVGQNLGAGKPDRAQKSAWSAVAVVEVFAVLFCLVMLVWTRQVIRLFNTDLSMDTIAIQFIQIAVVGWAIMGFSFVLMSCLQGAGDTLPTMFINIATTWIITIPLAYYLPKYTGFGAVGIRWAMTASMVVGAIANVAYFRAGRWKRLRF
jgi:putative MATE family efflux protein